MRMHLVLVGHVSLALSACARTPAADPAVVKLAPPVVGAGAADAGVVHPAPLQFTEVARRRGGIELRAMEGALFLGAGVALARVDDGGKIAWDKSTLRGLPGAAYSGAPYVDALGGRWPESAWMTLHEIEGGGRPSFFPEVYLWQRDQWVVARKEVDAPPGAAAELGFRWTYGSFASWSDGRVVALKVHFALNYSAYEQANRFTPEERQLVRPRFEVVANAAAGPPPRPHPNLCPSVIAGLPSGEMFALGEHCETRRPIVQRWATRDSRGTIDELPKLAPCAETRLTHLHAVAPNDVYVAGSVGCGKEPAPYFAHFDGVSWSIDELPSKGAVSSLSATREGTLWLVAGSDSSGGDSSELWQRPRGGKWEKIALPESKPPYMPAAVFARAADDVWVVATRTQAQPSPLDRDDAVVYTTKPASAEVLVLPDHLEIGAELAELSPSVATERCSDLFVPLASVPKDAAPSDYPEVRAALTLGALPATAARGKKADDVTLEEVQWRGTRTAGIRSQYGGYDDMQKQVTSLEKKLKKKLEIYCGFHPRALRTMKLDPKTGTVLP